MHHQNPSHSPVAGFESQSGQSIVIIALALVGLVAFAALIIDGGTAYAERRHMQNAADAGALAGARALADGEGCNSILDTINTYAITKNTAARYDANFIFADGGESAIPSACSVPPKGAYAVRVTAYTSFNTFFATMLGSPTGAVSAQAAAAFGTVNSPRINVAPIAPQCDGNPFDPEAPCGFRRDTPIDIWDSGGPGNLGWLGWDNTTESSNANSANTLCANFTNMGDMVYTNPDNPNDHTLSVGDWVPGSTGVKGSSCIKQVLQDLVDTQTPVTIIIWGQSQGTGSNVEYQIIGFAKFTLQGFNLSGGSGHNAYGDTSACTRRVNSGVGGNGGNGNGGNGGNEANCIQGTFQSWMDPADICFNCYDFGVRTVKLVSIPPPTATPGALPPVPPTRTPTPTPTNTPTNTRTPTSTPTITPVGSSQICVLAYNDVNRNGNMGPNEGRLTGAQISIRDASNAVIRAWTTNGTEPKCFGNLADGAYSIGEVNPVNYTSTTADAVNVNLGVASSVTVQFGDRLSDTATPTATSTATATNTITPTNTPTSTQTNTPPPNASPTSTNTPTMTPTPTNTPLPAKICAKVYNDLDLSATQNGSEPLLAGAMISITNKYGTVVSAWTTGLTQPQCSSDLPGGLQYMVTEINPSGFPASTTSDLVTIPSLPSYPQSTLIEFGDVVCMNVPSEISNIGNGINTPDYTLAPAKKGDGRSVTLRWGSTVPASDAFAVYRKQLLPVESDWAQVATVGGLSWTDTTPLPNKETWQYYVQPFNHCGVGPVSLPITVPK